ncbi:hypothetical protein GCM10027189_31060 [Rufibacter soli]
MKVKNMKNIAGSLALLVGGLAFSSCLKEDVNPAVGTPSSLASIYVVKDLYRDADVALGPNVLSGAYQTTGTVISDPTSGNLPAGSVVIQSNWRSLVRGLILKMDPATAATLTLGDSVVVDLNGATLTKSNGSLQVTGLTGSKVNKVASNRKVTARAVSLSALNSKFSEFESTLVSVTADVKPLPVSGETIAGSKTLDDGSESTFTLFTEANAAFAATRVAPNATFVGIPFLQGDAKQLRLRNTADILSPSGPLYPGYPEDFESPLESVKNSYASKAIDLRTGNWTLNNAILGNTVNRDRIVSGKQAIRFQQNLTTSATLQMNYDLPNGATKVTVWYGAYYTDASSTFALEYSTDKGVTWKEIGRKSDAHSTATSLQAKQAVFMMNIQGPVRFRINKLGLGPTSVPSVYNGRLGIDDFAVYQNY